MQLNASARWSSVKMNTTFGRAAEAKFAKKSDIRRVTTDNFMGEICAISPRSSRKIHETKKNPA